MPSGPSRGEPKRVVELGYRRAGTAVETVQWRGGRTHGGPARTGGASPNANGADPKVDPTLTGAWSFRRRRLAPSVVAVGPRSEDRFPLALSPALAPASGSVRWRFGSEDPRPPSGGSETRSSVVVTRRWRRKPGRSLDALPVGRPGSPGRWWHCFRVLLERSICFEPKFSACRSRRPRGQLPPSRCEVKSLDLSVR